MNILLERPLPIITVGGLLAVFALVVFLARRDSRSLAALGAVLLVTVTMLAVERFAVTQRELVETAIVEVMAAIKANDLPRVLDSVDPAAAAVHADASALMPLVKVDQAHAAGTIEVDLNEQAAPPTATSRFLGFLNGVHPTSGMRIAYFNQQVEVRWVKRGDRWLVDGYTAYYDGQPIDAVSSARGNRPVRTP